MSFKRCSSDDPWRHNISKVGEVAVVFSGENGLPLTYIDFSVYANETLFILICFPIINTIFQLLFFSVSIVYSSSLKASVDILNEINKTYQSTKKNLIEN